MKYLRVVIQLYYQIKCWRLVRSTSEYSNYPCFAKYKHIHNARSFKVFYPRANLTLQNYFIFSMIILYSLWLYEMWPQNLLCVILLLYRGNGSTTIVNNLFYRHSVQNETGLAFLFRGFVQWRQCFNFQPSTVVYILWS